MRKNTFKNAFTIIISVSVIGIILLLIIYPKESLKAAASGVHLWLNTVFPSLLPFFIGSELLIGLGIIHFIGVLLEPIMRPLFNVPGAGSFAVAMGFTSGYPMGAKIISRMRQEKLCTKTEAERLMSFCNNSGPLFMIGAVGVGMYKNPLIGYFIIFANYLGAVTVGLIYRFYKQDNGYKRYERIDFKKALHEMNKARKEDGRTFGELLSDSIVESVNTIMMIGGFIVFFSVLIHMLNVLGIVPALLSGIIEITVGTYNISISSANIISKIALSASIIAWGGLSAHAQILSIISKTDISYMPFLISKILHSIFTFIYTYIIFRFINMNLSVEILSIYRKTWLQTFQLSTIYFINVIAVILIACVIIYITKKVSKFF